MPPLERSVRTIDSIVPVIASGVTSRSSSLLEFSLLAHTNRGNETYGRYLNKTLTETEQTLENYFDAERALVFGSGMAAISSTILALINPGAQIVYSNECYRKTDEMFNFIRDSLGVDTLDLTPKQLVHEDWIRSIEETKELILLFIETPSNPLLKLIDVSQLSSDLTKNGVRDKTIIVVDSTMATPYLFNPRQAGADIEIHSATKYLGGHDDLFAGVVLGGHDQLEQIQEFRSILGGISSPVDLAGLSQRLATFSLRMAELSERGLSVAKFLSSRPEVNSVYYPGLPTSPDFAVAQKWTADLGHETDPGGSIPFGSVISFEVKDPRMTEVFASTVGHLGVNFGGTHTILDPFGYRMVDDYRRRLGISTGLFRLSVGLDYSSQEVCNLLRKGLEAT
jgi:cystathionine gamma-synthase